MTELASPNADLPSTAATAERSWQPYNNQLPFRRAEFDKIPDDAFGLYGIWYCKRCIYVGQAKMQPIARRLAQHWRSTHSDDLDTWIQAKGPELRVSYLVLDQCSDIDGLERSYIKRFQPMTNKKLK